MFQERSCDWDSSIIRLPRSSTRGYRNFTLKDRVRSDTDIERIMDRKRRRFKSEEHIPIYVSLQKLSDKVFLTRFDVDSKNCRLEKKSQSEQHIPVHVRSLKLNEDLSSCSRMYAAQGFRSTCITRRPITDFSTLNRRSWFCYEQTTTTLYNGKCIKWWKRIEILRYTTKICCKLLREGRLADPDI